MTTTTDPRKETKLERFARLEAERLANRQFCMVLLQREYYSPSGIYCPPRYCINTALRHGHCRVHGG